MTSDTTEKHRNFDKQRDLPDEVRVENAMAGFIAEFGPRAQSWMNACVRCGLCAEACHFYLATGEEKYTPIHKIKPFEDAYALTHGPFSWLHGLLGRKPKLTIEELEEWEELIYDSCNMCGRCTLACPMGIDIASLVKDARRGMYAAGLLPDRLARIVRNAEKQHSPFGSPEDFRKTIKEIEKEYGIPLPLDKPKADVLMTITPEALENRHFGVASMARVLHHLGYDWTFCSDAFEATNFGYLSGNMELQGALTVRLIDKAREIGASMLIVPECGHAWGATRWEAAKWYGAPVDDIKIRHIVEVLADAVEDGKLECRPVGESATFHDPCQQIRRGGLEEKPRILMRALGMELREMDPHGLDAFCCGGGGGVLANERAGPLRLKAFELKKRAVEETGADHFVTSCNICEMTLGRDIEATGFGKQIESLIDLIGANMITDQPPLKAPGSGAKPKGVGKRAAGAKKAGKGRSAARRKPAAKK